MIQESEFFAEAHALCGSKRCSIRNIVKSQTQTYTDALGLDVTVQADDDIFECDYILSVKPTTITQTTQQGVLQFIKGWQAVFSNIPSGKEITPLSRITLQDDPQEHIILRLTRSLSQNLYTLIIS